MVRNRVHAHPRLANVTMTYDDVGSGSPVLLLHSGVCDRRMWRGQVDVLERSHRVIAPDLAGFGDTPLTPGPVSYADELAALLDHLGLDQVAVVGSSFGGRVALELTDQHPDRVGTLVLLCGAYGGVDPTPTADAFEEEEERLLEAGDLDGAVALNVATWVGPDADDEARELVRVMQRQAFDIQIPADEWDDPPSLVKVDPDLSAIKVPTYVVLGGQDMDHFQNIARHLAAEIPDAHLVELGWAGHLPALERPAETAALLTGFLADPD